MKVVILCGGKGTRAYPFTEYLPKPMLPVAGTPILVQVMRLFAAQGIKDFVLSVGYRKEVIRDYFEGKQTDWNIELVDTGVDTDTGGRILGCRDVVGKTFLATYADGLSDVSIPALLDFHQSHPGPATITTVPLRSQYGTLSTDDAGRVLSFREKPILREHWINAGFFVFDRGVFDHWEGADLERQVFPHLAKQGLVYAHRHEGFFKSLDSYKDQIEFEQLVQNGETPWIVTPTRPS
jgi:glucose-1-phosphate cytidylyltransferase